MEQFVIIALLVALCSATSPPFPNIIALDCNETLFETDVAMNLINEHRDEGFVFRPVRIKSVFQQEPVRKPGGFIYYMDLDVVETKCSVLSGKSWKECSNDDIAMHEIVFGHCKVITVISRPWRILKLLNYNCTLGTVPSMAVARMCPDCPSPVSDITPRIKAKANLIIQQFNKESNQTHHFKVDEIERVRTQYMFGESLFFNVIIKETECLKTQADVNLDDCAFRADKDAHVGFCTGGSYHTPDRQEKYYVSCEIYNPRVDKDYDDHRHRLCGHGPDRSSNKQGEEKNTVPSVDAAEEVQKDAGEAGKGKEAPGNCEHERCPLQRGHKHHRCRHDHHHHHHPHHHNDSHHHDHPHHHDHSHHHHHHHPHHHDHPHHHHHHHDHHNHTASKEGSSSEEHSDKKPFEKRSKGSVEIYYLSAVEDHIPHPTIVHQPLKYEKPGKHGKFDNIEFPSEQSKLKTCPGEPMVELPQIVQDYLFK